MPTSSNDGYPTYDEKSMDKCGTILYPSAGVNTIIPLPFGGRRNQVRAGGKNDGFVQSRKIRFFV